MAGNFAFSAGASLASVGGPTVSQALANVGANGQVLVDDLFGPAPTTLDLAPFLANITDPAWIIIIADGEGFKMKFDGVGSATVKAFNVFMARIAPNTVAPGLLDLELTVLGTLAQRIRVLAIGDLA